MAGLYIHVPFCATRCLYCDFFSNTNTLYKEDYISATVHELKARREYLGGETIQTIYFGGGTPSQLDSKDFEKMFDAIQQHYVLDNEMEITLEANPDDMTSDYVASLHSLPFNRISMGVQSFDDRDLLFLKRRHTSEQAVKAVAICKEHGYTNISIDLIYGLPGQTAEKWEQNLTKAIDLDMTHLSAYHLIYEEGTPLYRLKQQGRVQPVGEEESVSQFSALIDRLTAAGFIHYEISNLAKPGFYSKHNSSYWTGKTYVGIGPSAHSFDGNNRQWNVSSLSNYIKGITTGDPQIEIEQLNLTTKYNEYVITGLRTIWGISLLNVKKLFGEEKYSYILKQSAPYLKRKLLMQTADNLTLSREGIFVSDGIMSDLLWV